MKSKSNILTVMKKELRRFFGDRRMLATLILPGLLIYVMYSLMGGALTDTVGGSGEDTEYRVLTHNMSEAVHALTLQSGLNVTYYQCPDCTEVHDEAAISKAINEDGYDAYLVFPTDFDARIAAYDPASGQAAPEVQIFYNSSDADSSAVIGGSRIAFLSV